MLISIIFIYITSVGLQLCSIYLFSKIYHRHQRKILRNLLVVIIVFISILSHLYSFLKNYNQAETAFYDSLFMLISSTIFYTIILFIYFSFKQIFAKIRKLNMKMKYDSLTKVLSRAELFIKCEREINRAVRFNTTVSLLIIDMDHFKDINDNYGHPIGDEVLIRSTKYCKDLLREIDLIGRIGGDEFIVLLPNTDIYFAKEVAERIQLKMKNLMNELSIRTLHPISLSIGIASYSPQENNESYKSISSKNILKNLIDQSDKALYDAKKCGRSQCAIAKGIDNSRDKDLQYAIV
jgi:diguanylate cyclase (GGDEF)-like protein